MNSDRLNNGLEPYRNPRNTASGSLKLIDSKEVAKRPLDCLLYHLVPTSDTHQFDTHFSSLQTAKKMGFNVPEHIKVCNNIDEVFAFVKEWDHKRFELPYETDGIVVKVNHLSYQKSLGHTSKSPRWAMAYKFKADEVKTVLKSVTYQVGRTGAITPVANLEPILLGGTIVKRASIHNEDQIKKYDLRIGDTVVVEKGGEIIPKITAVDQWH